MNFAPCAIALCVSFAAYSCCARCQTEQPQHADPLLVPSGTYTITGGDSIRIPFELVNGELQLIGEINNTQVRILIDNGTLWDQLLFFASPEVDALDIPLDGEIQVGGAGSGEPIMADMAFGIQIAFQGEGSRVIEFQEQEAVLLRKGPGSLGAWNAEAQISAALFKNFVVGFNFDDQVMTLDPPDIFDPSGKGTPIPMNPNPEDTTSWMIPASLTLHDGRKLEFDMAMDLGWDDPIAINTGGDHDITLPEGLSKITIGYGTQGKITGYHGIVPGLQIADYQLNDVPATYSTIEDGGAKENELMIGLGTFSRFNIHFDYQGHRLFLKPNQTFDTPFIPHNPE